MGKVMTRDYQLTITFRLTSAGTVDEQEESVLLDEVAQNYRDRVVNTKTHNADIVEHRLNRVAKL